MDFDFFFLILWKIFFFLVAYPTSPSPRPRPLPLSLFVAGPLKNTFFGASIREAAKHSSPNGWAIKA